MKETREKGTPKPTEGSTATPVQNKNEVIPPVAQGSSRDDRNDNNEDVRPVADPSDGVNVSNIFRPSTFSPAEARQDPGRSNPDKTTASDGHYQGGQSRNPSRAFLRLVIFSRLMTLDRRISTGQSLSGSSDTAQPIQCVCTRTPPGSSSE